MDHIIHATKHAIENRSQFRCQGSLSITEWLDSTPRDALLVRGQIRRRVKVFQFINPLCTGIKWLGQRRVGR